MAELDITLGRSVDMLMLDFAGQVLEPGQLDENIVVLTAIIEHGGQLSTQELARHLLGTDATHLARRMLDGARHRGLVEQRLPDTWTATDAGVQAIERNAIVTRTFGLWRATFLEDPLIGTLPYSLERIRAPSLRKEVSIKKGAGPTELVPQTLRDVVGEEFKLPGAPGSAPVIESVDSRHCLTARNPDGPRLEWVPSTGQAYVISNDVSTAVTARSVSRTHLGKSLARSLAAGWHQGHTHLCWPESRATDRDVMTQLLDLTGRGIDIDEFGSFTCVTGAVPIVPRDPSDAVRWLIRRCSIAMDSFVTSEAWPAHRRRLAQGLGGGEPDRMNQQVVAAEIRAFGDGEAHARAFWYLQAPLDWGI